ncbi:hypothetical protein BJ165DRAFT_1351413 [Panaeolus papilionaceus]|nr:hypothetical protein BJ165DRAFT_1351413 [Panaeolus papilionaceus]
MNLHRHGAEHTEGIGGGLVSEESARNLEIAERLCLRGKPYEAVPYLQEALKDPNNLDAGIQLAFLAPTKDESVNILMEAEERGQIIIKRAVGPNAFKPPAQGGHMGEFWDVLETRPYMRVMQALVRMQYETGRYGKAVDSAIRMLILCPGDNLAVRFWLGSLLLHDNRNEKALSFAQEWIENPQTPTGGVRFKKPHSNILSPEEEAKHLQFGTAQLWYTAALAAFRLKGDHAAQANQYLKVAVTLNPHVLLKILAKVKRPENLNNEARAPNSPQDAHDYLWLSHGLWMEEDVWKWVDENADVKSVLLKKCSRAECPNVESKVAEYKRCGECHLVSYCGVDCQKQHWKTHKPACKQHAQQKSMARMFMLGKSSAENDIFQMDQYLKTKK